MTQSDRNLIKIHLLEHNLFLIHGSYSDESNLGRVLSDFARPCILHCRGEVRAGKV